MPRLSIIIPALGDWESLETTLVSVLQNRPPRSEVVVVLNQTYDDPYDLEGEVRFVEVPVKASVGRRRAGLVELVNAGLAAAHSEMLHVLSCGATVADGWTEAPLRHFGNPRVAAVAPLVLDVQNPNQILTAGCTWSRGGGARSFGRGLRADTTISAGPNWIGPELVAGFYRRATLASVAGLDGTLPPELAAVDLNLQLLAAGGHTVLETACQIALESSALRPCRSWTQGWQGERLFWRYAGRRGLMRDLSAHAWLVATETLRYFGRPSGLARALGRVLGACDRRGARRSTIFHTDATHAPNHTPVSANAPRVHTASDIERRVDAPHAPHVPRELRASERGVGAGRKSVNLSSVEKTP
ncbi:MAG TPA: glycosyltransferase [Pirellulales bacterium]|nr:glycosyltransferase [Pirellulales bacterium]